MRAIGISDGLRGHAWRGPQTVPMTDPANYGIGGSGTTRDARTAWLQADYTDSLEPAQDCGPQRHQHDQPASPAEHRAYAPANGAVYPNTGPARGRRSTAALIKADIGVEACTGHRRLGHALPTRTLTGGMSTTMTQLSGALGASLAGLHLQRPGAERHRRRPL
ncbi:MAG: hypothetical protein IPK33_05905 [Gemmatimonadetes bacterium]|nr:hypothetical protein [Gemmatimonadota bacterium]